MASAYNDLADTLSSAIGDIAVSGERHATDGPSEHTNPKPSVRNNTPSPLPDDKSSADSKEDHRPASVASDNGDDTDTEDVAGAAASDASITTSFYTDAQTYWDTIEPTVDGMLGGFAPINAIDIRGSLAYLQSLYRLKPAPKRRLALDCGAGIGRVTKHLLLPQFERVDAVEQCTRFAEEMRDYVGDSPKLGTIYNEGLQEFTPAEGAYDVIWSQWVLGHLTDNDLVAFFRRCVRGLSKNGIMVLKENVTSSERTEIDEVDSSLTRPLSALKTLLVLGGMRVVRVSMQHNFPAGIYPVYMIAVRPL